MMCARQFVIMANENQALSYEYGWVPLKPLPGPFVWRLKDAWAVFTGRAVAVEFDELGKIDEIESSNETEQTSSQFRNDMLAAFRHGKNFKPRHLGSDLNCGTAEDKRLPFAEWFNKYY